MNIFTDDKWKCFKCPYKGKFIKGFKVNEIKWKRRYIDQVLSGQDQYICPSCGTSQTGLDKAEYDLCGSYSGGIISAASIHSNASPEIQPLDGSEPTVTRTKDDIDLCGKQI